MVWRRFLRVSGVIQAVHPKGNQSWIFLGWTDAEAETPVLWPPDVKNRLIGKDPDAGKDWRQEEKGLTEDEMVGWHHQLNGNEFEQAPGAGDGQVCCSPWGRKESDTTDWTSAIYLLELMKSWELEENTKRLFHAMNLQTMMSSTCLKNHVCLHS